MEYLNHWQKLVELLGITLYPDHTSCFLAHSNQFTHFPLLSLKLREKIRGSAKMMAGVARCLLCWTIRFLWFEAVTIGKANGVQVVSDVFPFNLLLIDKLLSVY